MKKTLLFIFSILLLLFPFEIVYAKRGCCSGKGGVAYCGQSGHYICKNGDPSPSCTCDDLDTTTYEEDKANGDLYYGDDEPIADEDNIVRSFNDDFDYNEEDNDEDTDEEKNSIADYFGPGVIVTAVAGGAYAIGKSTGKKK